MNRADHTDARSSSARPWIGVKFLCSGHYVRVYRHADGTHYCARCPRCAQTKMFVVGPAGTGERFFELNCRT